MPDLGRLSLNQATTQRWVYPNNHPKRQPCNTRQGLSEIGVGADGRVLWYITVTG